MENSMAFPKKKKQKNKKNRITRWSRNSTSSYESDSESRLVMFDTLQPSGLYSPQNFPGQNAGVGRCSLLQRILPTQGLNPGLPHCRWILYQLSHKGSLLLGLSPNKLKAHS